MVSGLDVTFLKDEDGNSRSLLWLAVRLHF
jgi:hypothetical protein